MTLPADLTLPGQVRATLERILASPLFLQAERQRRLLGYVVEESLAGRAHRLNQFALAVDVFDRDATFDPAVDAVVRVDVARLRARLREYYEANPDERVVIRIPKGSYVADFDFGAALRGAAPPAATASHDARPVIAVLPFAVIGDAERDACFADGVSEDLITDLAKISRLRVIARNSSFAYRGRSMPAAAIGRDLGATHLLEGSVRRAGERLRINAQLSACASGEQVWAERYDRDATDIFAVQDKIASKIVTALAVVLSTVDRYRRDGHGMLNLQAYDAFLRATALGWAVPEVRDACRLLDVAIGLDAQYSLAYARRADRMWYLWCIGATGHAAPDAALACVDRAIELDHELAEAHAVAGFIRFWNGDHEASTRAFERAESLAPENARNLERHAFCLAMSGQTADATEYVRRAQVCNPHEPHYFPRAMIAFVSGDFAQAVSLLRASVDRFPAFLPSSIFLAAALELVGDSTGAAEAVAGLRKANAGESFPNTLRHWLPATSHPGMRPLHEGFARAWSLWESGSR